jgi:hypothetical protein
MREKITIGKNQTAVFTLPNGVQLSVSIDDGGLFIYAGSDDSKLRASIRFHRNCGNEGWIQTDILAPIVPQKLNTVRR